MRFTKIRICTVNAAEILNVSVTGYNNAYDKTAHSAVASATATTVDGIEVTFTYVTSEDGVYGEAPEYTDAGVYTVWYKAVAANHNEVTGSFTVTISKAVVDLPEIESKPYNGEIQTATDCRKHHLQRNEERWRRQRGRLRSHDRARRHSQLRLGRQ